MPPTLREELNMKKEDFLAKLKDVKSVDDVIALAKENGLEITPEKAKELFDQINSNCELSDDELEGAAGGKGLYWIGVF